MAKQLGHVSSQTGEALFRSQGHQGIGAAARDSPEKNHMYDVVRR